MRTFLKKFLIATSVLSVGIVLAQVLGTGNPTDDQILATRIQEGGMGGAGIFDIPIPPPGTQLRPVQRLPRKKFGQVGPFPLQLSDLDALVYPDTTLQERQQMLEGVSLFTSPHGPQEGAGPLANQPFCLGCHTSTAEALPHQGLLSADNCKVPGSTCVSIVSRAARSTPTNFRFTSLDSATGGGVAPDILEAVNGPGRTAAFTIFSDFNPTHEDAPSNPTGIGFQDPLDGTTLNIVTGTTSQPFGGFVQHVRPSVADCLPDPIPPAGYDALLQGSRDPMSGVGSSGFRRSTGERAGPPYIGRGLMEAIPTADLAAGADPNDAAGSNSSLGHYATAMGCTADCVAGKINMIPRTLAVHTDANGKVISVTGFVGGQGRFGLRANGVEILQFSVGGLQGELGITSNFDLRELNFPTLFPTSGPTVEPPSCLAASGIVSEPEAFLSAPFSERHWIRNIAPPEFGPKLVEVLERASSKKRWDMDDDDPDGVGQVRRGAELFGIDVVAFANRMIPGRMPAGGDGRDAHAINQSDRRLNCVGCHTPVQRTGQSPATVAAHNLSFVWAPIFSDLLLHRMPVIDAERIMRQVKSSDTPRPRDPLPIERFDNTRGDNAHVFTTFDLPRNLADDTFSNLKASAEGREFRTAPLMGMGRMGPPFLHDGRVYLSSLTVDTTPAGTVTSNNRKTNAPLVVRTVDDAIRAAIELHDLPAPDDAHTSKRLGGGCPVPHSGNIDYGASVADVICPAYDSAVSKTNRSDSAEVIRRFRALSRKDQQALIEFLKQL